MLTLGAQTALARTTPCGTFDTTYGYYGQCDANNNPIVSAPLQNTTTNTYTYPTTNPYAYPTVNPYAAPATNPYAYSTINTPATIVPTGTTYGCGQYDPAGQGTVVCDSAGRPIGFWVTDNAQPTQQPVVNIYYGNQSQNNVNSGGSSNPYATDPYQQGYNYGSTNYGNSAANSYGPQLLSALFDMIGGGGNYGGGYSDPYQQGYDYGSYNYGNSGYNYGSNYSSSYNDPYQSSYYNQPSYDYGYSNGGYDDSYYGNNSYDTSYSNYNDSNVDSYYSTGGYDWYDSPSSGGGSDSYYSTGGYDWY